ncbi:hypothetical protein V6574_27910 [Streptomyces sp. SM1P]
MPGSSAGSAWVLFSGYGFAQAHGTPLPPDTEQTLRIARYSLWTLRRSRTWREALESYRLFDPRVRGYEVLDTEAPATRRQLSVAADRFSVYEQLLRIAPPLEGKRMPVAGQGPHAFPVSRTMAVVDLPPVPHTPVVAHDMDLEPAGGGEPWSSPGRAWSVPLRRWTPHTPAPVRGGRRAGWSGCGPSTCPPERTARSARPARTRTSRLRSTGSSTCSASSARARARCATSSLSISRSSASAPPSWSPMSRRC